MQANNGKQIAPVIGRDEQGVAIRWQFPFSRGAGHNIVWYTWDELEKYNIKIEGGQSV